MRTRLAAIPLAAALLVAGCATVPSGPNVMVLPGPQKSMAQFQDDQMVCQQYASNAIGGQSAGDAAANSAVASAALGTALGAAAGAIIGSATGNAGAGAAWGAGTGLLWGSAAGSNAAGYTYVEAQRRYDIAYVQCMYARGNQVPGQRAYRSPPPAAQAPAYPPPNTPPPNLSSQGSGPPPQSQSYPPPNTPPPTLPRKAADRRGRRPRASRRPLRARRPHRRRARRCRVTASRPGRLRPDPRCP